MSDALRCVYDFRDNGCPRTELLDPNEPDVSEVLHTCVQTLAGEPTDIRLVRKDEWEFSEGLADTEIGLACRLPAARTLDEAVHLWRTTLMRHLVGRATAELLNSGDVRPQDAATMMKSDDQTTRMVWFLLALTIREEAARASGHGFLPHQKSSFADKPLRLLPAWLVDNQPPASAAPDHLFADSLHAEILKAVTPVVARVQQEGVSPWREQLPHLEWSAFSRYLDELQDRHDASPTRLADITGIGARVGQDTGFCGRVYSRCVALFDTEVYTSPPTLALLALSQYQNLRSDPDEYRSWLRSEVAGGTALVSAGTWQHLVNIAVLGGHEREDAEEALYAYWDVGCVPLGTILLQRDALRSALDAPEHTQTLARRVAMREHLTELLNN